jgi:preprotein translocase subunit SecA
MSFLSNLLSFDFKPEKAYAKELQTINGYKESVAALSDIAIREEIEGFKKQLTGLPEAEVFSKLQALRPRVFALTREAAKRSIGQFHYDVQVMGGIALSEGKIAEMKTGEGKTLTATLPLVLNALAGKGTHIVTVNDYLSRWQASLMGPVFHFLGLSVGSIQHEASFVYDPTYQPEAEEIAQIESEDW